MTAFIEKQLNANDVSFWDPIRNLNVKMLTSITETVKLKATDDKIVTAVSGDRKLFARLLIVANTRQINLLEVMTYELSPIPCALTYQDSILRKNSKCYLRVS